MEHLLILPTFVLGTLLGHFYLSNHDGIVVVEESFSTNLERVGHSSESIMNDLEARIDEIEEETVVRSQLNPNRHSLPFPTRGPLDLSVLHPPPWPLGFRTRYISNSSFR